jgi:hypothetical protein
MTFFDDIGYKYLRWLIFCPNTVENDFENSSGPDETSKYFQTRPKSDVVWTTVVMNDLVLIYIDSDTGIITK